jgi:hypothetical protein
MDGVELNLQVLYGKGDAGSNVVNLYAKKLDGKWKWYYIDHESPHPFWGLSYHNGDKSVMVKSFGKDVAEYEIQAGRLYLHGRLQSNGDVIVGNPCDQVYPVRKMPN